MCQFDYICHSLREDINSKKTFSFERSKDDYDNDVSDNCDHNFGTFDDFGVKMTKKYRIT